MDTSVGGSSCPAPDITEVLSGTVTMDTTHSTTLGAPMTAIICVNFATLQVSLSGYTKFVIAA